MKKANLPLVFPKRFSDILINFRLLMCAVPLVLNGMTCGGQGPLVSPTVEFAEVDGMVAVEAEHAYRQSFAGARAFHLTHSDLTPAIKPDPDPSHVAGASGGAYVEVLPDTRVTHDDKLSKGVNFAPLGGQAAILHYRVHFSTPGRYYVWVRAYSTGSEDNGLHVGIDGQWPESGQRMQWCEGKQSWWWESRQRTEQNHCGEFHKVFLDVRRAGVHEVMFSMREDGFEFDKFILTTDRDFERPTDVGPEPVVRRGQLPEPFPFVAPEPRKKRGAKRKPKKASTSKSSTADPARLVSNKAVAVPRGDDGDASVAVSGESKRWHNVILDLSGPFANEKDDVPNPFTDYRFDVAFTHASGAKQVVPGYFAADGNAANSSADSGNVWRAHFAPPLTGKWAYEISFKQGPLAAITDDGSAKTLAPFHGQTGSLDIVDSDKQGRDFRSEGKLSYVNQRYLQFAQSGRYFLKAGADAPETLLAYQDFDGTLAGNPKKAPLKSWSPHVQDWNPGDPTWGNKKGKGLIGAINYLSGKGCNAFSFLTYNAGGDGDNVWPFTNRDDKLHYDCSKLDQWGIVFDHGTRNGMYLHFKMQETENDDHLLIRKKAVVPESLDGGDLGPERKLYCRELIARFAHNLALNWNLGEENTQSTQQVKAMIDCIDELDSYDHLIVLHTYPNEQDKVYPALLGDKSKLTGVSLQNSSIDATHRQTVKWVDLSTESGKPWVVAFDESGNAMHGQSPDLGYREFDGHDKTGTMAYTQHDVRRKTLWGTLMGGGAGVEYYFGYQFVENDIVCEDWRSRDQSWDYCRIAINFFRDHGIPFSEMRNADELVGNPKHQNSKYCFAKPGDTYLVYLPRGGKSKLNLSGAKGEYVVQWFNPRIGGDLQTGSVASVTGGGEVSLGSPPAEPSSAPDSSSANPKDADDWLALVTTSSR